MLINGINMSLAQVSTSTSNVPFIMVSYSSWTDLEKIFKNSVTGLPFRVKMCTAVTMPELIVVHHELGHVWYFMMYRDQPTTFQEGANPGRLEIFCKNSYPLSTHPYHLTGKFGNFSLKYPGATRAFFTGDKAVETI